MISFAVFMALYIASLIVAMLAGLVIVVGYADLYVRKTLRSLRYNAIYILIIVVLPVIIILVDMLLPASSKSTVRENVYTSWIFQLAGGAIRVLQARLNYGLLTDIFVFAYVWVFTFMTAFSPLLLLAKDDRVTLRRYSIALMLNYIILLPFVLFIPVTVPGGYPQSGITPLLYVKSNWGRMVTSIDPLNNGFPSGHTSLCVATLLIFALAGAQYRRYVYFLIGATVSIVFSVLYLGIHWPLDVFVGFLVGVFVVVVSGVEMVEMTIDRYVRVISSRLLGKGEPAVPDIGETNP